MVRRACLPPRCIRACRRRGRVGAAGPRRNGRPGRAGFRFQARAADDRGRPGRETAGGCPRLRAGRALCGQFGGGPVCGVEHENPSHGPGTRCCRSHRAHRADLDRIEVRLWTASGCRGTSDPGRYPGAGRPDRLGCRLRIAQNRILRSPGLDVQPGNRARERRPCRSGPGAGWLVSRSCFR